MSITRIIPILALAATFAAPLAAGAQTTAAPAPAASGAPAMGHHHHHRRHHQSLMHALRSLNLTDAQKKQIATFRSQEQQANMNADAAAKHANAAKLHDQIMGVLTPDEKTQLQSSMHHGKTSMHHGTHLAPNPAASPDSR